MLWCLALMVPIQYGVLAVLRTVGELAPIAALFLSVAVNLLLFGFLPALFVYVGRVELRSALGLSMPRPAALLAGLLLGISLWPMELYLLKHTADARILEQERFTS